MGGRWRVTIHARTMHEPWRQFWQIASSMSPIEESANHGRQPDSLQSHPRASALAVILNASRNWNSHLPLTTIYPPVTIGMTIAHRIYDYSTRSMKRLRMMTRSQPMTPIRTVAGDQVPGWITDGKAQTTSWARLLHQQERCTMGLAEQKPVVRLHALRAGLERDLNGALESRFQNKRAPWQCRDSTVTVPWSVN